VEVAVHENISALKRFAHHLLHGVTFAKEPGAGSDPLPVQVVTSQRAPVIADNHSVWVEHGHDFEHEFVSENTRALFIRQQIIEKSLHNPAGI